MSNTLQTERNLIKELDFQYGDDGWIGEVCELSRFLRVGGGCYCSFDGGKRFRSNHPLEGNLI